MWKRSHQTRPENTMTTYVKPPDGGYGWVVVVASFFAHIFQYGIVWTVGIFYVIFVENMNAGKGAVALIASLNTAVYYGTGPLAGALTNHYGHRMVAMTGGLIGGLGLVLSMFATNVYHLYCTFGILTGFGFGLAYIPSISIVGLYFERRRTIAFGLAASGCGLGTFIFPPLIRYFVWHYGWRSALMMVGGICLNMCACGALMRPIKLKSMQDSEKKIPTDNPIVKDKDRAKNLLQENQEKLLSADEEKELQKKREKLQKQKRANVLNLAIFKNTNYLMLCLNNVFFCFGLSIVYVHFSAYAASLGFTDDQGALLFSIIGLSNFIGRIAFGVFAHIPCVNSTLLYLTALSLCGVITEFLPLVTSMPSLMVYTVLFGFLSAVLGSLLPQVIVKLLSIRLMASGYGYLLIFEAIGTLLGAPTAGWLYEATGIYASSFYLGGAFIIVSGFFMIKPWKCPLNPENMADEEMKVKRLDKEETV